MKLCENPKIPYPQCGTSIKAYSSSNNDAPSITKYGSLVWPDAQIVALRVHCAKCAPFIAKPKANCRRLRVGRGQLNTQPPFDCPQPQFVTKCCRLVAIAQLPTPTHQTAQSQSEKTRAHKMGSAKGTLLGLSVKPENLCPYRLPWTFAVCRGGGGGGGAAIKAE